MNKTEHEIISKITSDLKRAATALEKKKCLILLESLSYKFTSKYSYYFYYFLHLPDEEKEFQCSKILSPASWIFSIDEIHKILHCRNKYKDNFHMLKLNVLDKLMHDYNLSIVEQDKDRKKVLSIKITYHGILSEKIES